MTEPEKCMLENESREAARRREAGDDPFQGSGIEREDFRRRKRRKNLVVLAALVAFGVLLYFVTLARMGGL